MSGSTAFTLKKVEILRKLEQSPSEYADKSPKGKLDEQIVELVHDINAIDGLVTTSSCSGRISVFLENRQRMRQAQTSLNSLNDKVSEDTEEETGRWLFSSHTPLFVERAPVQNKFLTLFGLEYSEQNDKGNSPSGLRKLSQSQCVHFKFEPMILHIASVSLEDTQKILTAALSAGFRESGAVNFHPNSDGTITPMVAVRSTGLASDTIIGYRHADGKISSVVDESYLRTLVDIANDRFRVNGERINKFKFFIHDAYGNPDQRGKHYPDWEDPILRKERKRAEGLQRQVQERDNRLNHAKRERTSVETDQDDFLQQGLGFPD